jgi:hypothetical protein
MLEVALAISLAAAMELVEERRRGSCSRILSLS